MSTPNEDTIATVERHRAEILEKGRSIPSARLPLSCVAVDGPSGRVAVIRQRDLGPLLAVWLPGSHRERSTFLATMLRPLRPNRVRVAVMTKIGSAAALDMLLEDDEKKDAADSDINPTT